MGIPLAALAVRPPEQQPGPLDQYGKALQLKSLMNAQALAPGQQQLQQQAVVQGGQENQMRAQQLADQQAQTAALKAWDGKDVHDLPGLLLKHGGSAQAVFGMKNQLITQQKSLAEADEATIKNQQAKNDMITGHLEAVKGAPADQKQQAFEGAISDLEQKGLVPPGSIPKQYPGDDKLDLFEKSFMGGKQIVDNAIKQRETKAKEQEAQSRATSANTTAQRLQAEMPGGALQPVEQKELSDFIAKNPGKGPTDFAKWKASLAPAAGVAAQTGGVKYTADDPTVQAVANNKLKIADVMTPRTPLAIRQQFLSAVMEAKPDFNSGTYDVEKGVEKAFTSGQYSQQLNSINRAREHMGTFLDLAKNINNTDIQAVNRVKNAFQTQFGGAAPGNLGIAKQAFASEVGKSFAGASVALADRQELDHKISEASSWEQLAGAAQTADTLLAGAQKALKKTYESGRSGKPNFGEQPASDNSGGSHPFFSQFGGAARPQ